MVGVGRVGRCSDRLGWSWLDWPGMGLTPLRLAGTDSVRLGFIGIGSGGQRFGRLSWASVGWPWLSGVFLT